VLTLIGGSSAVQNEIILNAVYVDPGATAIDDVDGDLSDTIVVDTSEVDTSELGVYRVRYSVRDSAGCEVSAERFVRVIALVPTSDFSALAKLCKSNGPRVRELCGGWRAAGAPNPAAFPGCCMALSDMDAAGCFCVPDVVREFEGEFPSVASLAAFSPLACGFRIKAGDVCSDQQLLSQFLSAPTAKPQVIIPDDVWTSIVDQRGVLREDIGCNDTLTVTYKYCGAITANAGTAPRVGDFAPCCSAASRLFKDSCLCDEPQIVNDDNFVFVRELVGFAPLGCGFNFTDECPALVERLGLETAYVQVYTPTSGTQTIPISVPVLSPARVEPTTDLEAGLAGGLSQIDASGTQIIRFADGTSSSDLFGFSAGPGLCRNYVPLVPEMCGCFDAGINRDVSVYNLTGCCLLIRAMHENACLCPPYGERFLKARYAKLKIVAREGCGIGIDAPPLIGCPPQDAEIYRAKSNGQVDIPLVAPAVLSNLLGWLNAGPPLDVNVTTLPSDAGVVAETTNTWLPSGDRNVSTAIPNSVSCLEALIATETSCVPAITGVRDIVSLSLSWDACCRRLKSIDDNRCLCDGSVALAMTTTRRKRLHRQFLRQAPIACGFEVTTGDRCPVVNFAVAQGAKIAEVSTSSSSTPLVTVKSAVYENTDTVFSAVFGNGGIIVSNPVENKQFPRGFTILSPQRDSNAAIALEANGNVLFELGEIPGVTVLVEPSEDGTTLVDIDGTIRRLHVPVDDTPINEIPDYARQNETDASVSFANSTVVVVQTRDQTTTIPLGETSEGDEGGIKYTQASQELKIELPDRTKLTIRYPETLPRPIATPTEGETIERPLEAFGVVVEDGVLVPSDAPDSSACDAIRELTNFLVIGYQPGATSYDVLGAIGGTNVTVRIPELTAVIGYRPRGGDVNAFVDAPSVPNVTCEGLSLISPSGDVIDDALCERVTIAAMVSGVNVTLSDVEICADCAIVGRSRDGVLFKVEHASEETLNSLSPVVRALQCDVASARVDIAQPPAVGGAGRRLLQFFGGVPFFPDSFPERAATPPLNGFNLTQYARPESRRDYGSYFDPTGGVDSGDPTGDFGGVTCQDVLPRVASSLRWFGKRSDVPGPYQTAPFDNYTFTGSIAIDSQRRGTPLTDVNVPIVLSAWVNDVNGTWREVEDPLEEYQIECFPTHVVGNGTDVPSADACGGLRFFMSSYAPEGAFGANERAAPKVALLELSLSRVTLCDGCSLKGANDDGALFKLSSKNGARFDYVGPSVGNPTCVADLRGRAVAPVGVDVVAQPPTLPPPVEPNATIQCNGEKGLNLKGILLRDGSKFITDTQEDCCLACAQTRDCDIWVYCTGDCVDFSYHSCWLKRSIGGGFTTEQGPTEIAAWDRGPNVPWTSGWFPRESKVPPSAPPSPLAPIPPNVAPVPPNAVPPNTAPDSATYFTLQPGVAVEIPASIITVIPGAKVPGANGTVVPTPSPPPSGATPGVLPPPPSNVAPTVPLPVPEFPRPTPLPAPTPTPIPIEGNFSRACKEGDAAICPTDSAPVALSDADVRLSVQLLSASPSRAAVTGTAINFGRVYDSVCLAGVSITIPFDRQVIDPVSNEQTLAPSTDFIADCVFVGVRGRDGPPSDDPNGCNVYASATVVDAGIEITFKNVALCKECWIVGGPAGVLFTIRHRDDFSLTIPVATLVEQNVLTETSATCAVAQ